MNKSNYLLLLLLFCTRIVLGQDSDCDSFLLKKIHPLQDLATAKGHEDLAALEQMIGDKRIVALGATSEGSHQEFVMKQRLVAYMIEELGFRTLALNTDATLTSELNEYLLTGEGQAKRALRSIRSRMLYTEEMMGVLDVIRTFNKNNTEKVQVVGYDMVEHKHALKSLTDFIERFVPDLRLTMDEINAEYAVEEDYRNYNRLMLSADHLFNLLSKTKAKAKTVDYEWALYTAKIIAENASFALDNQSALMHDQCLAENVSWIADRLLPGRVILWSVNSRIDQMPFFAMGSILHEQYGDDYFALGFATHSGYYAGVLEDNTLSKTNELELPNDKCYEHHLKELGALFLLDLEEAEKSSCKWLTSKLKFREVNLLLGGKEFLRSFLPDSYDAVLFIEKSEAAKMMDY